MTENDESVIETLNSMAKQSGYTTPPEEAPEPSVLDHLLLQAMSITKVKVELKGIKRDAPVIALADTSRVKGIQMEAGTYSSIKGRLEIFLTSTVNTDITLKKGTQLGLFQICQVLQVVTENEHEDAPEVVEHVCSVQGDLELGRKFRNHLNSTSHPDLEQELINLLIKHKAADALPGDALGKTDLLKHQIKLKPGTQPIYIPSYRLAHTKLATVDKLINEMLSQDVIEPSDTEWNFPLILVPKSDGNMRLVMDYRELDKHTVPDRLLLPVISDILRSLGTENQLFSTTDNKSSFWQV